MLSLPIGHAVRLYVVGLLAFLLGAAAISGVQPAKGDPVISISPIKTSYFGDHVDQEIEIKAFLETGNPIDTIRLILDGGTEAEKVYEFDINGKVSRTDAGFTDAFCAASLSSDGYSVGPSVIDCKLVLDISVLAAGTHQVKSELVNEIGTFADNSEFTLLA